MNDALANILFQLTGKRSLEEVSMIELQKITEAHPYFSIGHLFFARKLAAEKHLSTDTQIERTAAYFKNTLWLDYLLRDDVPVAILPSQPEERRPSSWEKINTAEQETPIEKIAPAMKEIQPETITATPEEEQYAATTTEEVMQQAEDEEKQKEVIASVLEGQLAEFKKPVAADAELVIETEPYHTVDYFASQGIRVDLTNPQDKLGSQVKKFTDWLKQMKHLKPVTEDLGTDPEVENMIQGIAKTSNETKEIVTETMAEVLIKQGKTDKAIQLYIKLSFLNPDKSAYFAAKIEQLKGI